VGVAELLWSPPVPLASPVVRLWRVSGALAPVLVVVRVAGLVRSRSCTSCWVRLSITVTHGRRRPPQRALCRL